MTTHTDTLRALADEGTDSWRMGDWDLRAVAALRAAADCEDAVRALADLFERSGRKSTSRLIREVAAIPDQEQTR